MNRDHIVVHHTIFPISLLIFYDNPHVGEKKSCIFVLVK